MFICPKKILMALLFMVLASPMAFQAVRSVLGGWISSMDGLPKVGGLAVHAIVFMVLSTMIWRYAPFGSSSFEGDEEFRRRRCYKRNKRTGKRREVTCRAKKSSRYEDEDPDDVYEEDDGEEYEDEEYNTPDPSKMHAGVYH